MEKYKAPALAKGLDIIDLLRAHGALSFNEIQQYTQDNSASLSRYLHTLIAKDYLSKTNHQKYTLGIKLIDLNNKKNLWPTLIRLSHPLMEQINREFGVTVLLLAYTKDKLTAIDKVIAPDNLGMMQVNHVETNRIDNQWSNQLFNKNLSHETILSIIDRDKPAYDIEGSYENVIKNDYMKWITCSIVRLGFPIRFNQHVVATIGIGSMTSLLSDEQIESMASMIQGKLDTIESGLIFNP